jgi:hypothetical protein
MSRPPIQIVFLLAVMMFPSSVRGYAQSGQTPLGTDALSFRVRVYNDEGVPQVSLSVAQKIADAVLQRAGLQARWQDCTVGNPSRDSSGCDIHPTHIDLVLYLVARLEAHAPNVSQNALGYSIIPDNGEPATMAYVCYSRVKTLGSAFGAGELLGMAMAHEIGHLLFNSNSHSWRGLMRATWPRKDLETGHREEFTFTSEQARHLRAAVMVRMTPEEQIFAIHSSTK